MNRTVQLRRLRLRTALQARAAQPIPPGGQGLEITTVEGHRLREPVSLRTYSLLEVRTRSGITGFGECSTITSGELALVRTVLSGKPASSYASIGIQLARHPGVRAAANVALLDILAKAAKAPLFQFLGGPTRYRVRALAPLEGDSDAALTESMRQAQAAGYKAFLVPVPPPPNRNQGQAYVLAVRKRMENLRVAAGDGADFVLDGRAALTPADASNLCEAMERFHLYWFDQPCASSDVAVARRLASEKVTPLGFGRDVRDAARFQELLREDAIDVLRPAIAVNGITEIRKMAAIAETYYVAVAPFHDGGPVGSAAALHLAASLPNFFIQQIPLPAAEADRAMRAALTGGSIEGVKDGFAALPLGPGLGVNINPDALRKYSGGEA